MIYIGNGIYSDSTPNEYLQHYGVKGMKWGQHLFSKDPTYFGGQKKKKRSAKQWAENKHRAHVANAEANKRSVNINASVSVNNKTKKLPRTSLGVLMKYDSLNENEYNQAMKNIRRRNEVYDAVINDAYRVHRAVNFAPTVLNDVTKTIKNVDYLSDRLRRHYNSKHPKKQTILGAEPKYVNVEDQKDLVVSKYKAQHSDPLREGNYLEHYGRKGMKWGEHIFGEDESRKRSRLGLGIGLGLAATGAAAAIAAHKIKKNKHKKEMLQKRKKYFNDDNSLTDDGKRLKKIYDRHVTVEKHRETERSNLSKAIQNKWKKDNYPLKYLGPDSDAKDFLDAGFTRKQIFDHVVELGLVDNPEYISDYAKYANVDSSKFDKLNKEYTDYILKAVSFATYDTNSDEYLSYYYFNKEN